MNATAKIYRNTVVVYYSHQNQCRFPLGLKLSGKVKNGKNIEWDYSNNNFNSTYPEHQNANEIIALWVSKANNLITGSQVKHIILKGQELQRLLESTSVSLEKKAKLMVMDFFNEFYEKKKDYLSGSENKSISSLKDYTSFKNLLIDFINENGDFKVVEFNERWFRYFHQWMKIKRPEGSKTRGALAPKSIKKRFDTLKTFILYMASKGQIPLEVVEAIKLFNREELQKPTTVFDTLTIEQVNDFYAVDFGNERLNNVRDVCVFGCMTSLRYQDLHDIEDKHVKNGRLIKTAHKTRNTSGAIHNVPLNEVSKEIWARHNQQLPKFSNVKLNEYIKEAFNKSGLFDYEGNRVDEDGFPVLVKDSIVVHDFRRTFISNMVNNSDLSWNKIMKMSAHTKVESLYKYIDQSRDLDDDVTDVLTPKK